MYCIASSIHLTLKPGSVRPIKHISGPGSLNMILIQLAQVPEKQLK